MREIYKDQCATVMFEKFFSEKIDTTKVWKNRALINYGIIIQQTTLGLDSMDRES